MDELTNNKNIGMLVAKLKTIIKRNNSDTKTFTNYCINNHNRN